MKHNFEVRPNICVIQWSIVLCMLEATFSDVVVVAVVGEDKLACGDQRSCSQKRKFLIAAFICNYRQLSVISGTMANGMK